MGNDIKVLITGQGSYIGNWLEDKLNNLDGKYTVNSIDVRNFDSSNEDFSTYDVIFHVAAIVHKKESPEMESMYMAVNRDLAVEIAKKAKREGVKQFIFMSTMAVYGEEGSLVDSLMIDDKTPLNPKTYYGKSKVLAENELNQLASSSFKIVILRPPMVYGPNCPGNYSKLEYFAKKLPIFPLIKNERSMVHVDTLCEFIKECIDNQMEGIHYPQDESYITTSYLVKEIAAANGKHIFLSKWLGDIVLKLGLNINLVKKVFGNLTYRRE